MIFSGLSRIIELIHNFFPLIVDSEYALKLTVFLIRNPGFCNLLAILEGFHILNQMFMLCHRMYARNFVVALFMSDYLSEPTIAYLQVDY